MKKYDIRNKIQRKLNFHKLTFSCSAIETDFFRMISFTNIVFSADATISTVAIDELNSINSLTNNLDSFEKTSSSKFGANPIIRVRTGS